MTTTLCGHERDALIWACSPGFNNEHCVTTSMVKAVAYRATRDPAKLAELMAEELRRRGVTDSLYGDEWYVLPLPTKDGIDLDVEDPDGLDRSIALTTPQARVALLRLMQLPEGTAAQDVLKALEASS